MMVVIEASVTYPVVVVKGNNITCRALLDSDAAIYYASSALLEELNIQLVTKAKKRVEIMIHPISRKIDVIEVILVEVSSSSHK